MEKQIKVSEFVITAHGDPSVGIFPSTWIVGPEFYFENKEELEYFRKELSDLFTEYTTERVSVDTAEEIDAEEKYLNVIEEQAESLMDELNDSEFMNTILEEGNKNKKKK